MAHHRDTTPAQMIDDRGYSFGRLVSQVFHPILMNILTFVIVGYYGLENPAVGLAWSGLCVLVAVLPPTLFYIVRRRQGAYGDEDVSIRQQRNELYLVGFVWALIATVALVALGLPRPHLAIMLTVLALGLVGVALRALVGAEGARAMVGIAGLVGLAGGIVVLSAGLLPPVGPLWLVVAGALATTLALLAPAPVSGPPGRPGHGPFGTAEEIDLSD